MDEITVAKAIAGRILQRENCIKSQNAEWRQKSEAAILALVYENLPSGSGWDDGTKIDLDASTPEKLVFSGSFHHMDENGSYDGYTDHVVYVRPSLYFGLDIKISGRDRNDVKADLAERFELALKQTVSD